jgi:hypothetical protein
LLMVRVRIARVTMVVTWRSMIIFRWVKSLAQAKIYPQTVQESSAQLL